MAVALALLPAGPQGAALGMTALSVAGHFPLAAVLALYILALYILALGTAKARHDWGVP
ncbi:hypothetical protein ABZV75_22265 [Streptomyces flaveolus]|uniref:hypothetical protein n=1 Tax=Streptomyces flaveolus TaxID=67297 RepID=UPI0033BCD48E